METIKIPPKRMAIYKKNNNALMTELCERGKVVARLNEGDIEIDGEGGDTWAAQMVVNAINLGFEPAKAFKLLSDEYYLEVVDLDTYFRGNEKLTERYLARVIGEEGKSKRIIEDLSDAHISIWEHSVGIIGRFEELSDAKEAVMRLLEGSTHSGVFSYLERQKKLKRLPRN